MTYKQVRDNFVQDLAENAYLTMSTAEEMKLAISAIEKQIPKKPIINKRKIQCVNGHNQPVQHYKYCPMCGQLMDWSANPNEKGGEG